MPLETAFSMDTSSIKYGPGVTREVGWDMKEQGARRVMVVTDPNLADKEPVAVTLDALDKHGIDAVFNIYAEAGSGFAQHAKALFTDGKKTGASPQG